MGKFVDWDISHNKDQNCSNCGMEESESNGCCEDEQKILKIDKEQKIAYAAYQLPQFTSVAVASAVFVLTSTYVVPLLIDEYPPGNSHPRWQYLHLLILICVSRI